MRFKSLLVRVLPMPNPSTEISDLIEIMLTTDDPDKVFRVRKPRPEDDFISLFDYVIEELKEEIRKIQERE